MSNSVEIRRIMVPFRSMDEMIFAALHVLLAYQGHSFEREEPRYF